MSAGSGTEQTNWIHFFSATQYSKQSNRAPESDFPNSFSAFSLALRGAAVAFSPLLQTLFFPGKARQPPPRSYCHFFCHANCEYRPPPSSLRSAPSPALVIFLASALLPFFSRQESRKEITPQLHQKSFLPSPKLLFPLGASFSSVPLVFSLLRPGRKAECFASATTRQLSPPLKEPR